MFTFKKAINSFLAVGITAGSLTTQNYIKANHKIITWEKLSENLEFGEDDDRRFNCALLNIRSCLDCVSYLKFKPRWVLVMESEGMRFYAMVPTTDKYWQRSRNYEWKLPLVVGEDENMCFISNMDRKTPGYSTSKISLYFQPKGKRTICEMPLFTSSIRFSNDQSSSPHGQKIYQLGDEEVDSIFCNFLITEKNNEKSKEKIIRWPCWIKGLVGDRKFKEPKKESKQKESNLNHFPLNYMLDNESLMWFS